MYLLMHPRSKHWHMIDYIIVRRRDFKDVKVTKVMCGADCWTDHRLVISKMKLCVQPRRRPQESKSKKKLNISNLHPDKKHQLETELSQALDPVNISNDLEESWATFRTVLYDHAESVLGYTIRKHQDWFDEHDEQIKELLLSKRNAYRALSQDPKSAAKQEALKNIQNQLQKELRRMQDSWMSAKAQEIQTYADSNNYKKIYDALKALYGPRPSCNPPLLSSDGSTLLTDRPDILKRWAEHFQAVLIRQSQINMEAIASLPQQDIDLALDLPPSEPEVLKAINQMSNGKAPGPDGIPGNTEASLPHDDIQANRTVQSHVGSRSPSARTEGCQHYSPLQEERKPPVM